MIYLFALYEYHGKSICTIYIEKKYFHSPQNYKLSQTDLLLICEDITFLYQSSHIKIAGINKVVHIIKLSNFLIENYDSMNLNVYKDLMPMILRYQSEWNIYAEVNYDV